MRAPANVLMSPLDTFHRGAFMKTWFAVGTLVFALGALTPLALGGQVLVEQARLPPPVTCASRELVSFTPAEVAQLRDGLRVEFTNEGEATSGRVCLFDGNGAKRMEITIEFAARERRDLVLETPPGAYSFHAEFGTPDDLVILGGIMNARWCLASTADVVIGFDISPAHVSGSVDSGGCIPGAFALGIVGLFASSGSFVLGKFPHVGAMLLYSRLAKPRLLDLTVRGRLYDLVGREPGVHAGAIVRDLSTGEGQTAYHLAVLSREKLLVSTGSAWSRHWFVAGRFSADQMRGIVTLRDRTRRRVYEFVVGNPGASLGHVSGRLGISLPQASRAVRALERAGLIARRVEGRSLSLKALRDPHEVYGGASEAAPV